MYLIKVDNFNLNINTDWKCYELMLFNIIQNALKYNVIEGDILILIRVKQQAVDIDKVLSLNRSRSCSNEVGLDRYIMETEIVDSGIGIPD